MRINQDKQSRAWEFDFNCNNQNCEQGKGESKIIFENITIWYKGKSSYKQKVNYSSLIPLIGSENYILYVSLLAVSFEVSSQSSNSKSDSSE